MSVTIVTNYGKLKIELVLFLLLAVPISPLIEIMLKSFSVLVRLFCDLVPRPCFNFLANAASEVYNGTLFHRSIKGFMIQVLFGLITPQFLLE
jgi:hypothetical protein